MSFPAPNPESKSILDRLADEIAELRQRIEALEAALQVDAEITNELTAALLDLGGESIFTNAQHNSEFCDACQTIAQSLPLSSH